MEDEEEQLLRQQYEQLSRHQLIVANERHDAIVTIADEMEQLHGLFRQLEEQVDEQSPLIQHIEDHVSSIVENLQSSNEELEKAIVEKKRSNDCKWWLLVIMIALIFIVAIVASVTT